MYMPEQLNHGLRATSGETIALQSVNVEVAFNNLLCTTSMSQVYKNLENSPIEAVYTFPLTSRAVLLALDVVIGDRTLAGAVVEKSSAEEQYEEAITDGNGAIMLEQIQPGLYTMNVGNILAGEEMRVTIRYAELYTWQGNSLRFHLPTTIAPRYGDAESAGLQPHQAPEYDLLGENRFQLKLILAGILAKAGLDCPSHQIAVAESQGVTVVTLATGEACMDRDFILNISSDQNEKDAVLLDRDFDGGFVALASFVPKLPVPDKIQPKSVKIVVDCSGSMNGDSIAQARQAISDILSQLRPDDFFNIITFGSSHATYFDRQVQANKDNITKVRRLLRSLEADMGGTEMQKALQATVKLTGPSIPQDILLITDGEIWQGEETIGMMKKSGHRVFTVGVGSSVSESFVRQLAQETGGACELVVPNEEMTEKIVRHFKRIFLPRAAKVAIRWPQSPEQVIPRDLGPVYDGDTLHVFARFNEQPKGPVSFEMILADGRTLTQAADQERSEQSLLDNGTSDPGPLTRLAIGQSLTEQNKNEATALAVRYQLISPYTNYLVVDVRAEGEKSEELPVLRKVPQMLAAGWGGTGKIALRSVTCRFSVAHSPSEPSYPYNGSVVSTKASAPRVLFSRAPSREQRYKWRQQTTPDSFIYKCNRLHTKWLRPALNIDSFDALQDCDLPDRILAALKSIASQIAPPAPEEQIVLAFLWALSQSTIGGLFNRSTLRAIKKAKKTLGPDERLLTLMIEAFSGISNNDWGPEFPMEDDLENDDDE